MAAVHQLTAINGGAILPVLRHLSGLSGARAVALTEG